MTARPDASERPTLRPRTLDAFIGQDEVVRNLRIYLEAARERGEALDHVLFYGPPGLGKTTLANAVAREMEAEILTTSGPVVEKPGDLVGLLTSLEAGDVLFIDEIHRLPADVEEFLYSAMEDYRIEIRMAEGTEVETVSLRLEPFTLVGATTRFGLLTAPLRARFGIVERLGYYPPEDLEAIVRRTADVLTLETTEAGVREVALRARGTPRRANRLLRRVRDFAEVRADGRVTAHVATDALDHFEVDGRGLGALDRRLLKLVAEDFDGGPVGVKTMAAALGEDPTTLEEVVEPYLIQEGLLKRTTRGRVLTAGGLDHLREVGG